MEGPAHRAAKLSRVPGVTIGEAARRFGVSAHAVSKARRTMRSLAMDELVLAALTRNGIDTSGTLSGLDVIAQWIDAVNRDGCTALEVRTMLDAHVQRGTLAIDGQCWTLRLPWP